MARAHTPHKRARTIVRRAHVCAREHDRAHDRDAPGLCAGTGKSPAAKRTFGAKTDAFRSEYIVWIASAKQDETRKRRIAKAVDLIASGKRFSDK